MHHADSLTDAPLSTRIQAGSPRSPSTLYAQRHNAVDNIIVILLQRLDRLLPADARLRHHELDVLGLETRIIHLLTIVLFLLSRLLVLDRLALVRTLRGVVVARVVVGALRGELLSRGGLSLGVEVLDFGFAEDAVASMLATTHADSLLLCGT